MTDAPIAYVHCGAALTRSALVRRGRIDQLYIGGARGDEALQQTPVYGDLYRARVKRIDKTLAGAFLDIGAPQDAFLSLKDKTPLAEGAAVVVQVRRAPIGSKGAVVAQHVQDLSGGVTGLEAAEKTTITPSLLSAPQDAALAALCFTGVKAIDKIVVNDAAAGRFLQQQAALEHAEISIDEVAVRDMALADAVEEALERIVPLPGGARMIFDETEGGCLVDIDAGGAGALGGGGVKANDRVNQAAALALCNALNRRAIGGAVIVDFLPPSSRTAREALLLTLKKSGLGAHGARIGALSSGGVCAITRPRRTPSLLEQATETAGEGWVRQGRRLTSDWCARHAIDALERRLRLSPSARPSLRIGGDIERCLKAAAQWEKRLAAQYGARFIIEKNSAFEERSYDLAE